LYPLKKELFYRCFLLAPGLENALARKIEKRRMQWRRAYGIRAKGDGILKIGKKLGIGTSVCNGSWARWARGSSHHNTPTTGLLAVAAPLLLVSTRLPVARLLTAAARGGLGSAT
jgi:hypothetical protein